MPTSTPSDLLSFLQTRTLPRRLLRVGLALTSTVYTLRPDLLLAKSAPGAGTSSPSNDWLGESGVAPFVPPAARFHSRGEVFFIDAGVADPEAFWLAVPQNATVVSIPAGVDSWAFMAQEAEKFRGLAAIHLVSHGEHGALVLNGRRYAAADLAEHLGQLRQLGRALTKNGDIFLYGCEAGAGREGQALLDTIAVATGADVAASSGDIGSKAKGGHWDLEVTTGPVDRSLILDAKDMAGYDYVLLTTSVNSISTLKSAILTAETDGLDDTITVTSNITFGSASDAITINVTDGHTMTIVGQGGGFTISGNNLARVINVTGGSVVLSNLTISNGFVTGNGGNIGSGSTGGAGGDALGAGILNAGTLTISGCTISGNKAAGGGGAGSQTGGGGGAGGGGGGFGSTFGGAGGTNPPASPGAASAGVGGRGAGYSIGGNFWGGAGGSTTGGAGSNTTGGYSEGGNGSTANNGTIAIGGGGGGAGYDFGGGRGGNAAGGIYNTGTLTITGSSITGNIGAGGGGGGGAFSASPDSGNGGAGGSGVGGIWQAGGTLHIDSSSDTSLSTGNTGGAGAGGLSSKNSNGAPGAATSTISTTGGTTTVSPSITSATYNAGTGVMVVTGAGMTGGDTITVSDLSVTGESGGTYTLTTSNVTASNSTTFSVTLNAADKLNVNGLLNNNGTSSVSVTPYNLAGTAGWDATASSLADPTGNGITVSGVSSPTITSSTYNVSTHVLTVTGTNLVATPGANNDITVSKLTLTGESGTYTLTSSNVDVTSATSFSVTLNGTDRAQVETNLFNKNGTSSTGLTTYNLAAADDWDSDVNNTNTSVATSSVTVSNVAVPTITSATYNAATGVLAVTGTGLLSLSGAANDIVVSDLTLSGDSTPYTLTSGSVDITNSTSFSVTLNGTDTAALASRLDLNGTSSAGSVTYNLAAASGWDAGAAVSDADPTGNGVTVSNFDAPPVVTTTGGTTLNYLGGASAATIDGSVTVSDPDNATQASGTVTIGTGFHSGDTLALTGTFGDISVSSYNTSTGVLTLTSAGGSTNANWQAALRAVTFSAGAGTTPGSRTISFVVNDGTKNSAAAAADTVAVTTPPVVTTDVGSAAFTAGDNTASTPVTIDSGLTVTDASTSTLTSATVSIIGNFHSAEDVLAFNNTSGTTFGNIAASYNSGTGVLTLTSAGNSATLAQWQAALDAVTYTDTAVTPNNATRTISFSVTDANSHSSNTATRTVTVTDTDQTPIVTTTGGTTLNDLGGTSAATIDSGVTVSDLDNTTQTSGTVTISSGSQTGDTLAFTNTSGTTYGNISASYNSGTHALTLTSSGATATDAQWANAYSAVTFSTSAGTAPGNRTISFVVNDGTKNSAAATDTVAVTVPPVVTIDSGSAAFVAGDNTASTPVTIDSGLTVTDLSSSVLTSATVSITGNFHSAEDVLAFNNTSGTTFGNIAASYNSGTGVLTLTSSGNTATLVQWNAALDAVTYTDTAVTPNNATRTISFSVTDANSNTSNTAMRTVTVTDTDQTPIVTTTGGTTLNYLGGASAATIDGSVTVSDLDNTTQASGTVSITSGFHSGDTLAFTNTSATTFGNISVSSYNAGTGVLTLTSSGATATKAQWASAFSAVTFSAGTSVTPGNRTISFVVNDGTVNSAAATDTVAVTAPPIVTTSGGSAAFTAGDNTASTPVAIDSGLTVTDASTSTLTSATVSITGNFHSAEDVLAFTSGAPFGNIAGSYNSGTGVLTLTSSGNTATLAQWNAALEAVTYTDTAVTPNNATRTISFSVADANSNTSNTATRTVTVTDTDQTPIVTTTGGTTLNYLGGASAATIDGSVTVSDSDNATQASGTVSITTGFHSGDTLALTGTYGNISVSSYNAGTGVLTLTSSGATATKAQWASAFSAVTFSAGTSATPGNRTISFVVNDGTKSSAAATDTVAVTAPPIVTTSGGSAAFTAGDNTASTPVTIDSGLTVTDASTSTLTSATVSITGNFHSGEDVLGFTNNPGTMGNIAGSYNSGTGVLTLTSAGNTATLAQWQAAMRAVTYTDTAVTPNNATRTISFSVTDANSNASNTATRTVTVADTDQTPIVTTAGSTTGYLSGASATAIDGSVTVSDLDNNSQASGTVSIGTGFHAGDTLAFTNDGSTMGNIIGSYNSGTGVLTLTSSGATATNAQWQAVLRAVTFSSSSTSYGNRTISFVVNDGTKSSAAATDTVNVTSPVNVTTSGGSAAFVAGNNTASTPVAVDPGLTVADSTTSVLQSATVSITGNFHSAEDVLAFTSGAPFGNIAGSYNSGTGVLTLTSAGNTATLAQWQAAMRAVTYTDTAVTPNNATRTISFSITDANSNVSNTATRTVTVADTDQSPIATTSGGSAAFVAGNNTASTPVAIDPGITVSDLDNTTLASATVSITGNFHSSEDVLAFTNNPATMGNIAGVYNSGTGVLTLTSSGATATIAQWQAALRSVTYTDTAVTPNNATRTISFVVNDGTVNGNTATRTVTVADTDQSPIITTSGGSAAFVAGNNTASTPVVIDSGITVSDLDNTTQASGTVSITGNFHSSEDVLAFNNTSATTFGNIVASYNSGTGVLTLTSSGATATIAQWRAALRAVTYTDTAVTPNNATRTISFVVNDGTVNSNTATRTVTVTDTDQSPIVTTSGGITNDLAGASAIAIDGSATVSDLDNTTQLSGTVSITGNFHSSEDVLAFSNNPATMGNILGSYNSGTGVLTLTSAGATATDAQWQAALRSVTYADTAVTPNTSNRTVSFVVNDGTRNSAAGTKTVSVTAVSASYPAPAPDGFASSATGGASTAAVTVTTAANFITQAQSSTPAVITVAGLLNLGATPVTVNSNKTIQGADANAALVGNLTLASGVSNVIIRGLNLTNPGTIIVGGAYTDGGDGITIAGASSVFITHCTFFDTANHAIAITNGADKITVSWCEFYYTAGQTVHRDSVLIGTPGAETAPLHVTLHHNFWSTNVDQQMPVATFGYVHLYSNDFDATGNTSATVSSDQAQLLSELNVYTGMASPLTVQNVNTALPIGRILALGNSYTTTTGTAPYSGLDQVFTPSYSYEALPVSDTAAVVSANAGNVAGAGYTDAAVGSASITGPTAAVTPATAFTLTSVPASFTPSTYQWRLGNLAISGATASTYTVSNTQSANAGIYTVAIGLVSGDVVVSTPFTVTLGAPPATTPAPAPDSGSSFPWYYFIGGGAMSDWFLGALAMLAAFREIQQRRRTRD